MSTFRIPLKKKPLIWEIEMCLPSVYYPVELSFGVWLKHKPFCRALLRPNLFRTLSSAHIATKTNSNLFANWPLCCHLAWTPHMLGVIKENHITGIVCIMQNYSSEQLFEYFKTFGKSPCNTRNHKEVPKPSLTNSHIKVFFFKGILNVDMSTGRWIHVRWMDS